MKRLELADVVAPALGARERGEGTVIATVVASQADTDVRPGTRLIISEAGSVLGVIDPRLDALLIQHAGDSLAEKRSRLRSYLLARDEAHLVGVQGGNVDIFFEVLSRPPRLVIVGAGHIAQPLARLGTLLGYEVTVLDDRPEFASRERFPEANQILVGPYPDTLAGVAIDGDTYLVLVTRGHVHDQACLQQVVASPAPYVGMIGSKNRVRTVLRHLKEVGVEEGWLERVHAPVGLDIGAQTPAEIALAIMAEIVNVRRGGKAPSLRLRAPRV